VATGCEAASESAGDGAGEVFEVGAGAALREENERAQYDPAAINKSTKAAMIHLSEPAGGPIGLGEGMVPPSSDSVTENVRTGC
jgi:hypothetical protein